MNEQIGTYEFYSEGPKGKIKKVVQIGVSKNWNEISSLFTVLGYTTGNKWQLFLKNVNYNAFMVYRKK